MNTTKLKLISAVAMACASSSSFANCASAGEAIFEVATIYGTTGPVGQEADYIALVSRSPACLAAAPGAAAARIAATSFAQSNALLNVISSRFTAVTAGSLAFHPMETGLAAGDLNKRWNLWARYDDHQGNQRFSNYDPTTPRTTQTNFDQSASTTQVGADFAVTPNLILGASYSKDRAAHKDTVTGDNFFAGYADDRSSTKGDSYAAYLGYQLSNEWTLGAVIGDGKADFSAQGPTASGDRSYMAANIAYSRAMGNWSYSGNLGYIQGKESFGRTTSALVNTGIPIPGTDGSTEINRTQLGVRAAYSLGAIAPFVGLSYVSDRQSTTVGGYGMNTQVGNSGTRVSLGADFVALSAGLSGGLSYEEEFGRSNSDNRVLSANVKFRF